MPNVRAPTLARAALMVGGLHVLAEQLGISRETLGRYVRGESPIPAHVFVLASEIVKNGSVAGGTGETNTEAKSRR